MQVFAWMDRARSCKLQSGKPFSWPKFEIGNFRILRNAAYSTLKLGNLFLVEKFAVSYWEEEHTLHAAQDKLLSKHWDKNRGVTPRVDNTLKMAKHYAFLQPLHHQPLTNILPFPLRQNRTFFNCKKANMTLQEQIRSYVLIHKKLQDSL
jgi:hypothetical protein